MADRATVHLLVERQGGCRFGYGLGQLPRFVAYCLIWIYAIQQRGQRAGCAQGGHGIVIRTKCVFQGSLILNGQKGVNLLALPCQAPLNPDFQSLGVYVSAFTPGMQP